MGSRPVLEAGHIRRGPHRERSGPALARGGRSLAAAARILAVLGVVLGAWLASGTARAGAPGHRFAGPVGPFPGGRPIVFGAARAHLAPAGDAKGAPPEPPPSPGPDDPPTASSRPAAPKPPAGPSTPADGGAPPPDGSATATVPRRGARPAAPPPAAAPTPTAVPARARPAASPSGVPKPPPATPAPAKPASNTPSKPADDGAAAAAPRLLRKRLVPPFWVDLEYDTHRTRALSFPPLFIHRTPKPGHPDRFFHADLSLTFGWAVKDKKRRKYISPLALFYGAFGERKTVWGTAALLMGYKRVGEQFNFGQFPLVWWWGNRHVRNLFVVPFHYQQKTPDSFKAISALLFWYGHENRADENPANDRAHFVAAPVFWSFRRGFRRFDVAAPLYFGGRNDEKGLRHATFFPLLFWQSREFGNATELWTPFWIQRKDRARRRRAFAVPPVLAFGVRTPRWSHTSALGLVHVHRNHLLGSRTVVAGPVVTHRDPRQDFQLVLPLAYRFADRERGVSTWGVVPLAFGRHTPERTRVYTLLGGGMRSKHGWGFGIPPLLTFARKDSAGTSFAGVGPIWVATNHRTDTLHVVAAPLAYGRRGPDGTSVGIPLAGIFVGRRGPRSHQVVTPLFWHLRDASPGAPKDTWVVPPVYVRKADGGFEGGAVPLVFFGANDRRRYAVAPLLLAGAGRDERRKTSLALSPLFVRSTGVDHRAFGIPPLAFHVRRGADPRRPRSTTTGVLPFYVGHTAGDRRTVVTPLGGYARRGDRRTWVFGPAFGARRGDRRTWGVAPLVFHDRATDGGKVRTHTVIVPLFLRRRTPRDDMDMWTPLIFRRRVRGDKPRTSLVVLPFYGRQRQPGGVDVDAGLGFVYARNRTRRTHTLVAGPFFHRLSRKALHTGLAPIAWWMDSEEKRRLVALPAIFHFENKREHKHTTIAPPFWFDRRQANGRRAWAALPFAAGGKRLYNHTRVGIAALGYIDVFRLRRNVRFVGHVPLLFRYESCGFQVGDDPKCRYTLWGSFPFFLYGKDGRGRTTHAALMLYYYDKRPEGTRLYTPLFGVRYEPKKTLAWYALTLGVKVSRTHVRAMMLPLFFHKYHRTKEESTTVVLPPLYVGQHKQDRRWFQAGLLVWQFRQQHQVTTSVLPPLFFYRHAYAERKLSWLLPIYLRDDHPGKDEAWTTVFPALYVQRRHGRDFDLVQFPLVWHIVRGENHGTFGAFLWWDIAHEGKRFQMVPGVYTRFAGPTGDTRIVGPLLAWWTRGRGSHEGDLHVRVLFGLFGGGVEDGVRYTSVFGARIRHDRAASQARTKARRARREARRARRAERRARRIARRAERRAHRLTTRAAPARRIAKK